MPTDLNVGKKRKAENNPKGDNEAKKGYTRIKYQPKRKLFCLHSWTKAGHLIPQTDWSGHDLEVPSHY